tara:strand:+ start:500 stop:745 length:246 start_codon:yes stop_codon:yes gene_type:complete
VVRLSELDEWKQAASVEAGLRREFHDKLVALQTALEKYLAGDYPNPRQNRPGTCEHDVNYWQQCETCNNNFLAAALAASLK